MVFDLLRIGTPAFLCPYTPRLDGAWVDTLDVDQFGQPSHRQLLAVSLIGRWQAHRWFTEKFSLLAETLPCTTVTTYTGESIVRLQFTTIGAAGTRFINTVLGNPWLSTFCRRRCPDGALFVLPQKGSYA